MWCCVCVCVPKSPSLCWFFGRKIALMKEVFISLVGKKKKIPFHGSSEETVSARCHWLFVPLRAGEEVAFVPAQKACSPSYLDCLFVRRHSISGVASVGNASFISVHCVTDQEAATFLSRRRWWRWWRRSTKMMHHHRPLSSSFFFWPRNFLAQVQVKLWLTYGRTRKYFFTIYFQFNHFGMIFFKGAVSVTGSVFKWISVHWINWFAWKFFSV